MTESITEAETKPQPDYAQMTRVLIEEIREHGRPVTGWAAGAQVLVLTTTGARTGLLRTAPLNYSLDGDAWIVTASKGGAPTHPGWFYNLLKDPNATIELERETHPVRATLLTEGAERQRLWDQHVAIHVGIGEYPKLTDRVIPIVVLERSDKG